MVNFSTVLSGTWAASAATCLIHMVDEMQDMERLGLNDASGRSPEPLPRRWPLLCKRA